MSHERARVLRRHRRRARSEEGAVLLVVLLILLVATASAAVSVTNVQAEVQGAGVDRVATQTRYIADAGITTTISWIDLLGATGQWLETWETWEGAPPEMTTYPGPAIPAANSHNATRTAVAAQTALRRGGEEYPALSTAAPYVGTSGSSASGSGGTSSGGAGGTLSGGTGGAGGSGGGGGSGGSVADYVGSTGPDQGFQLPAEGCVVDITDCLLVPGALAPGSPLGGGSGSFDVVAFHCTLTAHGRLLAAPLDPDPDSPFHGTPWTLGTHTYNQNLFAISHDSRAEIITPEMIIPK